LDKTQQAKNLLNDPFFIGEIEALKNAELAAIVNSQAHQVEEREFAYNRINALQSVITHFESIAATSEIVKKRWKIL
jgi:uncharacterized DUF497 family protein